MIDVASVDLEVNLLGFSRLLTLQGIPHRIVEESGRQVIQVADASQAAWVRGALADWLAAAELRRDSLVDTPEPLLPPGTSWHWFWRAWHGVRQAPATAVLIMLCLLVALVSGLGRDTNRVEILFFPPLPVTGLLPLLAAIDGPLTFLRTLTPMLLHFGELHLIFNLLWLWYFGRQLESMQSSLGFLLVVLVTSFTGNVAQYLVSGAANFGGMSGVVYGLVGYTWILHNFVPRHRLLLNNGMFVVFVLMMVLMEVFASSWIASAAHAGGLLAGLVCGVTLVLWHRLLAPRSGR